MNTLKTERPINGPTGNVAGWMFGLLVITVGILNLVLVHAVPGTVFLLLSLIYLPPVNKLVGVPLALKIILGVVIIWFTLGVSDLGDIIDKWLK